MFNCFSGGATFLSLVSLCLFGCVWAFFFCWCNILTPYFVNTVSEEIHQMSSQCFYVHLHEQFAAKRLANKVAYNKFSIHFCLTLYGFHKVHITDSFWHCGGKKKKTLRNIFFLVNVCNEGHWISRISLFYLQSIKLEEYMWTFARTRTPLRDPEYAWMGERDNYEWYYSLWIYWPWKTIVQLIPICNCAEWRSSSPCNAWNPGFSMQCYSRQPLHSSYTQVQSVEISMYSLDVYFLSYAKVT